MEDAGHLKMRRQQKTDIFHPGKELAVNDGVKGKKEETALILFCTDRKLRLHSGIQMNVSS